MNRAGTNQGRTRSAVSLLIGVACVAGILTACSNGDDGEASIRMEPAANVGTDPFTETVQVAAVDDFPTDIVAVGTALVDDSAADEADGSVDIEGTTPGLYGGSTRRDVCDPQQLVEFLDANPEKADAWASVFDIPPAAISGFVDGLTSTVLLTDTRVTNHGFREGRVTTFQAVLEAGTAVLVDDRGVPRVKCNCGNPLAPPASVPSPEYQGDEWDDFDPQRLVEVRPGAPASELIVVDLDTGERTPLPVGSSAGGSGWVIAQPPTEGLDSSILTSADGATWDEVATIPRMSVEGLTHGPGGWVAVGRSAETASPLAATVVYTSPDLTTWTKSAELDGLVYDVASSGDRIVAVGDSPGGFVSEAGLVFSTPMVHTSPDGINWTTSADPLGPAGTAIGNRQPLGAVEYAEGVGFVLGAIHADDASESDPFYLELFLSPDGETWTAAGFSANGQGSAMSAGGEARVRTHAALAAGDGMLVQAAQPWVPPENPDGLGDAPRIEAPIVIYEPPSNVDSVPCGLCNPDGEPVDGTPFEEQPVSEMAFGDGTFLAISNSGGAAAVFRSSDARDWQQVGELDAAASALAYGPLGSAPDAEPVEPTTTSAPTTTTTAPTTTATPPPSAAPLGETPVYSETGPSGSGCNPGADVLPNGWWYGFAKSPIAAGSSFDFDLACYYYGLAAAQAANAEDPLNYPDASFIDNDYYVSNSNERTRPVSVAGTADLRCIDMGSGEQQTCPSPGAMFGVWVRVESGVANKVIEQFVP